MPYTNIQIGGSNSRKMIYITCILLVYYYLFYFSQGKSITGSQAESFLGETLFLVALQNTPLILL